MEALNEVLGGYGVEAIPHPNGDGFLCDYVNNGHTYRATIVRDLEEESFQVSSWGDFYENWLNNQATSWGRYSCVYCSYLTEVEGNIDGAVCDNCGNLLFE